MKNILKDLEANTLIEAMVANTVGFIGMFKDSPEIEASLESGAAWFRSDIPFPLFNGVFRTNLSADISDSVISKILSKFKERDLPMIWSVTPLSRPRDLAQRLESQGLKYGGDIPSMAVDLNTLPDELHIPDGLAIQTVQNRDELASWCDTLIEIYQFPAFVSDALFNFLAIPGFGPEAEVRNYMGFENGRLAAVSTVLFAGGVAGIYNVGTYPSHRHRGFGRAITLAPLLHARERGYRVGVLQSTKMGFGLYSKLGFKEYCKFGRFFWVPESDS
jgi:ribosomal protein S18 acetylase RimI-like enzyme